MAARMRPRSVWAALVATGVLLIVGWQYRASEGAAKERDFVFSIDEGTVVLEVAIGGQWTTTHRMYGDGRLVSTAGGTSELELAYSEREALLRILVDGGFVEFDPVRLKGLVNRVVHGDGTGAAVEITLRLDDYEDQGPVAHSVRLLQPGILLQNYPGDHELEVLASFLEALSQHVAGIAVRGGDDKSDQGFVFSLEPDHAVIEVRYPPSERTYTLYGDGRFVTTWPSSRALNLTYQEREELVGLLVAGGFFEWDTEAWQRLRKERPPRRVIHDGMGLVELTLRLEDYRGEGPTERTITTLNPTALLLNYPGVEDFQELDRFLKEFRGLISEARAVAP